MSEQETIPLEPQVAPQPKTYWELRLIAVALRVIAYIAGVAGVASMIYGLVSINQIGKEFPGGMGMAPGLLVIVVPVIYGALGFLGFLAASELILLLINLESNTRENNVLLRKIVEKD